MTTTSQSTARGRRLAALTGALTLGLGLAGALPAQAREAVDGTAGPDRLTGTAAADVLHGYGGADVLEGRAGDDVLRGGRGSDLLRGGTGDDRLGDRVFGDHPTGPHQVSTVRDAFAGGPGADRIVAGLHDVVRAGYGDDLVVVHYAARDNVVDCGPGDDVLRLSDDIRGWRITGCETIRISYAG